jgi:hypothetical protein
MDVSLGIHAFAALVLDLLHQVKLSGLKLHVAHKGVCKGTCQNIFSSVTYVVSLRKKLSDSVGADIL